MAQHSKTKNIGLQDSFIWFEREFKESILNSCMTFWETNLEGKLYSLTESDSIKNDAATKFDSFFTHKIKKGTNQSIIVRFSCDFVKSFLDNTLGKSEAKFSLFDLTDLEVKILNSCAEFIVKNLNSYIIQEKQNKIIQEKKNYNLTVLVRNNSGETSKVVVSVPEALIAPKTVSKTKNFITDDFLRIPVYSNLVFGTTKISLSNLRSLTEGDYILLEDSYVENITIIAGKLTQQAKIKPDLSLVEDMPEIYNDSEGEKMAKNIWDDIQVDVSAEFQNIKMSLGDLKQISNGIVIDIDDVFKGKINLVVENKVVARGDLVIINDKYGVRIDEVTPSVQVQKQQEAQEPQIKHVQQAEQQPPQPRQVQKAPPQQRMPQTPAHNAPQQHAGQNAQEETENFDYSNFEEDEVR